ncbi:MAG: hypothetical protein KAR42_17705 [candidate division Zixibacteria bacterium]|nr:hypothetical protein [candidate division Zixibacteria bacterium]
MRQQAGDVSQEAQASPESGREKGIRQAGADLRYVWRPPADACGAFRSDGREDIAQSSADGEDMKNSPP